jgi:hypothetical protein
VVSEDGSPHGPKTFVLWNPPRLQAGRRASGTGGHGDLAPRHAIVSVLQGLSLLFRSPAQAAHAACVGACRNTGCRAAAGGQQFACACAQKYSTGISGMTSACWRPMLSVCCAPVAASPASPAVPRVQQG